MKSDNKNKAKIKYLVAYMLCFFISHMFLYCFENKIDDVVSKICSLNLELNSFYYNMKFVSVFSFVMLFFTIQYNCTNFVDLAWGSTCVNLTVTHIIKHFSTYSAIVKTNLMNKKILFFLTVATMWMSLIFYGLRHILIYFRQFHSMDTSNEDFRYKDLRTTIKNKPIYWTVNFLIYHLIPLIIVVLSVHSIFDLSDYVLLYISPNSTLKNKNVVLGDNLITTTIGMILSFSPFVGLLITAVSDEQLYFFRINKKILKEEGKEYKNVINTGFWKKCRHPNYLGELLYYNSLFLLNFVVFREIRYISFSGALIINLLFIGYSIPAMEKQLSKAYGKDYQMYCLNTKCLIPYVI